MDFSLKTYNILLNTLKVQGFFFKSVEQFLYNSDDKKIALRHDVDLLPENSLAFARIEADKGIKGTYYFRIVPKSFNKNIIKEIYSMGHEIGYHYEDLVFASQKSKVKSQKGEKSEDFEKYLAGHAIVSFEENLANLREIVPVKTICMHGSPTSKWDSRLLWKYYDYHDFGIVGEPYFDINFNEVLYLTDTGRRWDGSSFNVRDRGADSVPPLSASFPKLHSTFDIISAAEKGMLPNRIMMTFHPQRWSEEPIPWIQELVWQNVKNVGKYFLVTLRGEGRRK